MKVVRSARDIDSALKPKEKYTTMQEKVRNCWDLLEGMFVREPRRVGSV